jgi:hypothetical protein
MVCPSSVRAAEAQEAEALCPSFEALLQRKREGRLVVVFILGLPRGGTTAFEK